MLKLSHIHLQLLMAVTLFSASLPAWAQTWTADGIIIDIDYKLVRDFVTPAGPDVIYDETKMTVTLHGQKSISEEFQDTDYLKSENVQRNHKSQDELETAEEKQHYNRTGKQTFSFKWTIVSPTQIERIVERHNRISHLSITLDKKGRCKFVYLSQWKPGFTQAKLTWRTQTGTLEGVAGLPRMVSSTCAIRT